MFGCLSFSSPFFCNAIIDIVDRYAVRSEFGTKEMLIQLWVISIFDVQFSCEVFT